MRILKPIGLVVVAALSALYLINPTAGLIELLPDNLPWIGNLDEGAATALLLWAVRGLRARRRAPLAGGEAQGELS
jgi:hypothetical protein